MFSKKGGLEARNKDVEGWKASPALAKKLCFS
jgi:hypothetical protein